ncbi:MAG: transglutaminase domain-containing protein [Clostridia bacterium]|nr:transglutaminase domain-containing protein [Clostridia bacterium]
MKIDKEMEKFSDIELRELFLNAISIQEKLRYFSDIIDDQLKIELLNVVPQNEKHKFIGRIKSTQGIAATLNSLDNENSKWKTFNFIAKQFKGNSKGLLEIIQAINFKITLPDNLLVFRLNNLNDLDIDKMIKIQETVENSSYLKFKVNEKESEDVTYSFPELSAIIAKITELTAGIPENQAEVDKFYTIYTRIINCITYNHDTIIKTDEELADRERKRTMRVNYTKLKSILDSSEKRIKEIRKESAGLYGGLVDGKAICVGYATILHEALKKVGLKSIIVTGISIEDIESRKLIRDGHAWNQVQIDGEWYNVDSTADASSVQRTGDIACMLRADNLFNPHAKFTRDTKEAHICKKDYPLDKLHFMSIFNQNRWWRGLGGGTQYER